MTVLHINPGPSWVVATVEDDRETRWCFGCRKRLPHTWTLYTDPPERQPSYYDPVPVLRCSGCNKDRADFPGTYLDGPRYPSATVWYRLMDNANWPPIPETDPFGNKPGGDA